MDARLRAAAASLALLGTVALLALALAGSASAKDLSVNLTAPSPAEHNAAFEVSFVVYNDASGATGAPVEIQLFLDNSTYGPVINIGAMPSNTQQVVFANVTAPCGSRTLKVAVDINDSVAESNEANNNATAVIAIQPIVNFTYALTGDVGDQTLTLTADTQGCAPLDYSWEVVGVVKTGSPVDYKPLAGEVGVNLTAHSPTDPAINRTYTGTVTIPNKAPALNLTLPDPDINTGQAVALQVQAFDEDGTIDAYLFDMGDGTNLTNIGDAFVYAYAHGGSYTITVTVTDNLGATAIATANITVTNRPPVADTPSFLAGEPGQTIRFDASGSRDPDGGNLTVLWNFGDGATATTTVATHAYASPGTYTATLTVTDADGATGTATVTVQVTGSDGGGGGFIVLLGILLFIAALIAGYFLLMKDRGSDADREGDDGADAGDKGEDEAADEGP